MKEIILRSKDDKPLSFENVQILIDGKELDRVTKFELIGHATSKKLMGYFNFIPMDEKGNLLRNANGFLSKKLEL